MTPAQTIQIRLSTCRQRLNELLQVETRSAEQQTEMEALTKEVSVKEPELRAALAAEPNREETRAEGPDAEARELQRLTERANVGDILSATFEKRQTSGEAAELQKHYGIGSHQVPLEMLRINRGVEERAAATVPASIGDASQAPVITPVFSSRRRRNFWESSARPCQLATRPIRSCPPCHPSKGLSLTRLKPPRPTLNLWQPT